MARDTPMQIECEVLVIGSGPGGATTAALLAEAGKDVLILEEGEDLSIDSAESYTLAEMDQKYRNGGITTTLGRTAITYIEGRCVGGASEINAALYHRPLPETLRAWAVNNQLDDFSAQTLERHFEDIESELSVSRRPTELSPASRRLEAGARKLDWRCGEVQRFWKYRKNEDGSWGGRRQSMSETLIPRARAAGARLMANTRVHRVDVSGGTAHKAVARTTTADGSARTVHVRFRDVFVCCGAVQTPAMLRRSGIKHNIGNNLRMHPMVRVAVRFRDKLNEPDWGVPVLQVEQFKPQLTIGCSHSSVPHIGLWLGDVQRRVERLKEWEHTAVFYAAVQGSGRGQVRNLPYFDAPLVHHPLTAGDLALLGEGLYRLGELAFGVGGVEMYHPVDGEAPIRTRADLARLRTGLPHGRLNVSTIHLFSSCPMGADPRNTATDSWGRLHGHHNILLNDASLLPDSPGVNPQGTIMAIARRNAERYLRG